MRNTAARGAEAAPAKVNLFLHVTGRRADGYHLLDSLAVFAGVADRLSHAPAGTLSLALTGPFAVSLREEQDNLVLRAAHALAAETGHRPTGRLTLEKHIPVASGVGGGSADAAAALRLLCRAWSMHPGAAALARIAGKLGADVPVCLDSKPARMRGVGQILSAAPTLPSCGMVLVNPGAPLASVAVFRARADMAHAVRGHPDRGHPDRGYAVRGSAFSPEAMLPDGWRDAKAMARDLSHLTNDLQAPAIRLVPVISTVLDAIGATEGCLLARMSGSGATCFGLYATEREARTAAATLSGTGWWCWDGALHGAG